MKRTIFIIAILTISVSTKSFACNCSIPKSLQEIQDYEYEQSDCIFVGEVFDVNSENFSFKIRVIESLKGAEIETVFIGTYDEHCGPIVTENGLWLVYADLNSENVLDINECGLTRSLKNPEFNTVIDGLIQKRLNKIDKENIEKINAESRKVLELELTILRNRMN
ncbi:hypothetical protein [Gillisia sp. CAL575]|uniref:hypothetical protein n=1 Tax=Gillisia sp. CAL575 TaxID=985255 RepID=UPI0003A0249D|nr:hypothetical protein [Gillisia sp. CAL575]